jgi:hypothetical protein
MPRAWIELLSESDEEASEWRADEFRSSFTDPPPQQG